MLDGKKTVVLIDCGAKYSIIRNLLKRGINVVRVPYDTSASEVMAYNPDGVFLSNGPGDPKKCVKTIECVREVVDKVPFMGICLGAQILGAGVGRRHLQVKVWSPSPKPTSPRPQQQTLLYYNPKSRLRSRHRIPKENPVGNLVHKRQRQNH